MIVLVPDAGSEEHFVFREYVGIEELYRKIRWGDDRSRCSLCRREFSESRWMRLHLRHLRCDDKAAALCQDCVAMVFEKVDLDG